MEAMRFGSNRRKDRLGAKLALTALVLGLLGTIAGLGTWAAFSATSQNPGNSFASGTVALWDDDSGSAMLSLSNAQPGDSDSSCIVVDYSGSLPSGVTLYGTTGGTGLAQYLDLTVIRGAKASGFDGCADFVGDLTDYIGSGPGVIYSGTLQGYPDNYGAGITDAPGSAENWTTGESHAYRFVITVQNDNAAQGLNADQTFVWEARNN